MGEKERESQEEEVSGPNLIYSYFGVRSFLLYPPFLTPVSLFLSRPFFFSSSSLPSLSLSLFTQAIYMTAPHFSPSSLYQSYYLFPLFLLPNIFRLIFRIRVGRCCCTLEAFAYKRDQLAALFLSLDKLVLQQLRSLHPLRRREREERGERRERGEREERQRGVKGDGKLEREEGKE